MFFKREPLFLDDRWILILKTEVCIHTILLSLFKNLKTHVLNNLINEKKWASMAV